MEGERKDEGKGEWRNKGEKRSRPRRTTYLETKFSRKKPVRMFACGMPEAWRYFWISALSVGRALVNEDGRARQSATMQERVSQRRSETPSTATHRQQ